MQSRETNEEFAREQENANKGWERNRKTPIKAGKHAMAQRLRHA